MNVRRDRRHRLFACAAEQGGHFTAAQARRLGYSYQAQAHHVGSGNWTRVDRALFRLTDWVPDTHDHLARWSLWSDGSGVVSHDSALSVHGVGEFESARLHMTVPSGFTRENAALILHRGDLQPDDVQQRTGFRVTTPIRSLIDVAASRPDAEQLARAVAEARELGLLTVTRLRARAEAVDDRAALYIERALQHLAAP